MRLGELLREVLRSSRAQKVPTTMVILLVAAMCVTTLLTVGRSASAEALVASRMDSAGSRLLVVTDRQDKGFLASDMIEMAGSLSTAERVVGTTIPRDVTNGAFEGTGTKVAAWQVVGSIEYVGALRSGRLPLPGEAVVSPTAMARLGMDAPVGFVTTSDGDQYAVVGLVDVLEPFDNMANGVIIAAEEGMYAKNMHVVADHASNVSVTQNAVLNLLARPDREDLEIQSPASLAELQESILRDVGEFGRGLMLLVLSAGAALTAIVVLADVLLRRTDLGRRRALGAPRWVIVSLVVGRAVLAGAIGALLGVGVAAGALTALDMPVVPAFAAATATLAVLTAAVASIPPAIAASRQDPVKVLRTP